MRQFLRGKRRRFWRECREDTRRILQLAEEGHDRRTIARRVGCAVEFVDLVLEKSAELAKAPLGEGG